MLFKRILFLSFAGVDIDDITNAIYSKKLEFVHITNKTIYYTIINVFLIKILENNDIFNCIIKIFLLHIVFALN